MLNLKAVSQFKKDFKKYRHNEPVLEEFEEVIKMIKAEGISCARRTVAKYRGILKFGTAQQRRKA